METLNLNNARLSEARESNRFMLSQEVEDGNGPEAPIKLAVLENNIYEATYKASIDPEINPADGNKREYVNS